MTKIKILGTSLAVITVLSFSGCGSSGGDSGNATPSKFDTATKINLMELDNNALSLITDDDMADANTTTRSLRSVNNTNLTNTSDGQASEITSNIANAIRSALVKSTEYAQQQPVSNNNARASTTNGNIITYTDHENGNISGTMSTNFTMNKDTGSLTGKLTYSNYKNSESSSCGGNEIKEYDGLWNVEGSFDTETGDIIRINGSSPNSFKMDGMTLKSGFSLGIIPNHSSGLTDDEILIITAEFTTSQGTFGFKDYKTRSYSYDGYEWSYPLEGNIYIFDNNINGYFTVDKTYNHSLTPSKEDYCLENTYEGIEKYIGDNSSLTWSVTSTNNYKVEIDNGNNGTIDKTITGVIND